MMIIERRVMHPIGNRPMTEIKMASIIILNDSKILKRAANLHIACNIKYDFIALKPRRLFLSSS